MVSKTINIDERKREVTVTVKPSGNIFIEDVTSVAPPPVFDPDAQAWIDRMTTPSSGEETRINQLIIAEKTSGNFSKILFQTMNDLGSINSLIDEKGKTAIVNGGVTFPNYTVFDGVSSYIDTTFTPATDGVNTPLTNFAVHVFIVTYDELSNNMAIAGTSNTSNAGALLMQMKTPNDLRIWANSSAATGGTSTETSLTPSNTLISMVRDGTNQDIYIDGVLDTPKTQAATGISNFPVFIGAYNSSGNDSQNANFTIGAVVISESDIDITELNTELRDYLGI